MISINGSHLHLVKTFLQQNKANKANLLSLPLVVVKAESRHSESKAIMSIVDS